MFKYYWVKVLFLPIEFLFDHVGGPIPCLNQEIRCQNGGSCQIEMGKPLCACPEGFHGETCQFSTNTTGSWTSNITGNP